MDERLAKRLLATFRGELAEHVRSLGDGIVALEKDPGGAGEADRLKSVFRAAHSLKGAARAVGLRPIEELCHELEGALRGLQEGALATGAELFAALSQAVAALDDASRRLAEGRELAGGPLGEVTPRLAAVAGRGRPTAAGTRGPAPAKGAPLAPGPRSATPARAASSNAPLPSASAPAPPAAVAPPDPSAPPGPSAPPAPPAPGPTAAPAAAPPPAPPPIAPAAAARPPAPAVAAPSPAPPLEPAAPSSAGPAVAPAASDPAAREEAAPRAEGFVRVPAAKLDALLARSGELLVAERRLEPVEAGVAALADLLARVSRDLRQARGELARESERPGRKGGRAGAAAAVEARLRAARADLDRLGTVLHEERRAIARVAAGVDEEVRRARMLPFADACEALERTARDVARERGKQVEVALEGATVEVDRSILEGLKDPLVCLVRNAADHGIEAPEERARAGKPPRGRIVVAAALRGAAVEVSVRDDGAGVDAAAIREAARRRGLEEPRDDRDCARLLFEPGFSTAARVTEISGRGVGLDIVKSRAEAMHGSAEISSERGRGTRVAMTLPVTLAMMRVVLASAGGETFAIPASAVERVVRVAPADVKLAGGREVLAAPGGAPIPVVPLAAVLGLPERAAPARAKVPALVLRAEGRAALAVDDVEAEREVLVKALGLRLRRLGGFSGATILETGRVALILTPQDLVRGALERPGEAALARAAEAAAARPARRRRIVLADDSATTRSLERAILEAAGYEVLAAVDGEEAWRLVQERGADLVVSDVDMPRMNGIALVKAIRASKRFRDLPFVLVTALDSEQDRARGGDAGADAYIVKSGFDQRDLVRTVGELLGGAP